MGKKRKSSNKAWHRLLVISGFSLLLLFILNLTLELSAFKIAYSEVIFLFLITILTLTFIAERGLKINKGTIYEIFYSWYLSIVLVMITLVYWIVFIEGESIGIFKHFIVLTHILVFLFSLLAIKNSSRFWFICVGYLFTAIISILMFAFIYWTISVLGMGHIQFNSCDKVSPYLYSENWFYFSSVTFYALGYGDICPVMPWARFISQVEVAAGALINTILIGFIFWKIRDNSVIEDRRQKKRSWRQRKA